MRSTKKAGKAQTAAQVPAAESTKNKPLDVREAGRKGGKIRATQTLGNTPAGKMSIEEAGHKGGSKVAEKYGPDYYKEIGKLGGQMRAAQSDVEVITEKFLDGKSGEMGIPTINKQFKSVYETYFKKAAGFRSSCRAFMEEGWKALVKAGFDTPDLRPFARSILEGTAERIGWSNRVILQFLPSVLKDTPWALMGQKGGRATAAAAAQSYAAARRLGSAGSLSIHDGPVSLADIGGSSGSSSSSSSRGFGDETEEEGSTSGAAGSMPQPLVRWSMAYSADVRAILTKAMDDADSQGSQSITMSFRGNRLESAYPTPAPGADLSQEEPQLPVVE